MACRQQGEDALYPGAFPSGDGGGYGELLYCSDLPHLQDAFHLLPHHQRRTAEGYKAQQYFDFWAKMAEGSFNVTKAFLESL